MWGLLGHLTAVRAGGSRARLYTGPCKEAADLLGRKSPTLNKDHLVRMEMIFIRQDISVTRGSLPGPRNCQNETILKLTNKPEQRGSNKALSLASWTGNPLPPI